MPRKNATALTTEQSPAAQPLTAPPHEPAAIVPDALINDEENHPSDVSPPSFAADPNELKTVALGPSNADPPNGPAQELQV